MKIQTTLLFVKEISVKRKSSKFCIFGEKCEVLEIKGKEYKVFPVYYPVGQGMRNIKTAKEDLEWILRNVVKKQK